MFPQAGIFLFQRMHNFHINFLCWICVGSTTTSECLDNIGETTVELDTSLCAAGLLLSLLLLLHFGCLSLDLTSTSQWTVNFTAEQWNCQVQFDASERWDFAVVSKDGSLARESKVAINGIYKESQLSLKQDVVLVSTCILASSKYWNEISNVWIDF